MFTILYSFQINRFPDRKSVIPIQMSVKIVESWTTKLTIEIMGDSDNRDIVMLVT